MKRFILISMMAFALTAVYSQDDLEAFQTGFANFALELTPTLSYNATVGNNWSDAYIGNFPHFGVGAAVGVTTVPAESLVPLFASMDVALPSQLVEYGLPIPAVALSAKIGGFILPFDVGLKGMILPDSLKATLAESGISADYTLIGGNIRYAVLKENILLPDVSVGVGYNRLVGSLGMELDVDAPEFNFNDGTADHTVAATNPALSLGWATNSYDLTIQVSKNLLFIRPYAGLGYTLGTSTVSGGLASELTYDGVAITQAQLDEINETLAVAGQETIPLSADGILFGAESSVPTLRVYGGVSLALFFLNLDASVTYVPATGSLGASAMLRVQF